MGQLPGRALEQTFIAGRALLSSNCFYLIHIFCFFVSLRERESGAPQNERSGSLYQSFDCHGEKSGGFWFSLFF